MESNTRAVVLRTGSGRYKIYNQDSTSVDVGPPRPFITSIKKMALFRFWSNYLDRLFDAILL